MPSPVGRGMGPSLRWDDGWGEVAPREREEEKWDPGSGAGVTGKGVGARFR